MKKYIEVFALVLAIASSVSVGYAQDYEPDFAEDYESTEFYSDANEIAVQAGEEDPDTTVLWEYTGENEDELKSIKKSNTEVSITNDYANTGTGSLFVEVKGAYGSMQFPFEIEKGKLYKLTYAAAAPRDGGETYLQSNIYAQPKGAHQGQIKLQNGIFTQHTKMIYYPDTEFTGATYGFYCNDAGKKFLLDDVKMVRYDDFGVSKKSSFYDGVKDVEIYSDIYLTFNYDINASTLGNITITDKDGTEVKGISTDVMPDKRTVIIQHDILGNNKEYTMKIDSLTDSVGRKLENLEIGFTTIKDIVVKDMNFNRSSLAVGETKLTGKIENHSLENKNVIIKLWLYRDLTMEKLVSIPVEVPVGYEVNLDDAVINVDSLSNGKYSLAASVWEDDVNIRPMCSSIRLEQ